MGDRPEPRPAPADIDPDLAPAGPPAAPLGLLLLGIAVGGALGAAGRHALELLWPLGAGFPTATFVTNLAGSFLLGALVALVVARAAHPLLRPVLGTGVLGGFTTFSAYAVQGRSLVDREQVGLAALYLGGTVVGAVLAALLGMLLVETALPHEPRPRGASR